MFKRHHEHSQRSPVDILITLNGELVDDLAGFAGASLDDLRVAFQLLPWADRAVLATYDVIDLDHREGRRGRVKTVNPIALDIVQAALERYDDVNTFGTETGHHLLGAVRAEAAVPKVDVVHHFGAVARQVRGHVEVVNHDGDFESVTIRVQLTGRGMTQCTPTLSVEVAPWPSVELNQGDVVFLGYTDETSSLGSPVEMIVDQPEHATSG